MKQFLAVGLCIAMLLAGCSIDLKGGEVSSSSTTDSSDETTSPDAVQEAQGTVEDLAPICAAPLVLIDGACCADSDSNGVCDKEEVQTVCGDSVCSASENECNCPNDCGKCEEKSFGACMTGVCQADQCVPSKAAACCGDGMCTPDETCNSCFQDCCTSSIFVQKDKLDLANYLNIAKGLSIVVGDKAPAEDVTISQDIMTSLASETQKAGKGLLASEITLGKKDYIVVGNPCDNPAAADLWREKIVAMNNTCQIFSPGEAIIKLFPTSARNIALYIGGYAPADTKKAAQRLVNFKDHTLVGGEVKI